MINCDFDELIKDTNVRYILQRIHDELKTSKADKPHIVTKVPSFTGKVELFNQNISEENDDHFIRCLNDNDIITNINSEPRNPNKNKDDIDYLLLNSPEEFKTPYIAVSFDVLDKQFLIDLYNKAIDILVVNPYPPQTQKDLVYAAIVKVKSQSQKDDIIFSWDEVDKEDITHIEIYKTLQSLVVDKVVELRNLKTDLGLLANKNTSFQAHILYTSIVPFTSKDCLYCPPLILNTNSKEVFYPKLKNKSKITKFTKENDKYRVFRSFFDKKDCTLTYKEIYLQMLPPDQSSLKLLPNRFDRSHKREIETVIKYLRDKFNNNKLITYVPDDSYKLTP